MKGSNGEKRIANSTYLQFILMKNTDKMMLAFCLDSWGSDENFSSFAIASTVGKLCLRESFKILSYLLHPGIAKCFEDKPYDVYLLF